MPKERDGAFLGIWPRSASKGGTIVAKAGGAPAASGQPAASGDDAEYATKDMLDEAVGAMNDKITSALDEIKGMLSPGDDPDAEAGDDPEAAGNGDEPESAATEDEIVARIPEAPAAFVASCVAASMTLTQVVAQYQSAARAESQTAIGRNRPRLQPRRPAAAPVTGTADGFGARVEARAQQFIAKEGMAPDRAKGKAISELAEADPAGYEAYQLDEAKAFERGRLGFAS